jgi:hypothetical protein
MTIAPNGSLDPEVVNRTLDQASSLRLELRRLRRQVTAEPFELSHVENGLAALDNLIGDLTDLLQSIDHSN